MKDHPGPSRLGAGCGSTQAEVSLCDAAGIPLDVVLFIGESPTGKSALLRGVASLLAEAVGAEVGADAAHDLAPEDVQRGAREDRCRVVFDDVVDGARSIITLEREIQPSAGCPGASARRRRTRSIVGVARRSDKGPRRSSSRPLCPPVLGCGDAEAKLIDPGPALEAIWR